MSPTRTLLPALAAAAILVLVASAALVARYRFERFVGLRYLIRRRTSRTARVGLVASALVTLLGLAVLILGGRQEQRFLETAGVMITLAGGLGVVLFLLLHVFSVFTTVSTMGIVLGVASLVVVLAVTSGFEREFEEKVLSVNAHLLIMPYGEASMDEQQMEMAAVEKKLVGMPGLRKTAFFSISAGEVMVGKVGANLKGVDLQRGAHELDRWLTAGRAADLEKPATCPPSVGPTGISEEPAADEWIGRIALGEELARKLRAKVGTCLRVLVPIPQGADIGAPPPSFRFQVVGVFRMGFNEYDTRLAYVSLADAKVVGGVRQTIFGLELRFQRPLQALDAEPEVERRLAPDPPKIIDWKDLNHNLFTALTMQKAIIALFLVLIIVVAAFNILASLTMIVLAKTREIAILASMGAGKRALRRIFIVAGSFVGFVGTGFGLAFGLAVCALAGVYGYPLDPKVYLIAKLPVQVLPAELLLVALATQLICLLATLYPATRASRLGIVEGLRHT